MWSLKLILLLATLLVQGQSQGYTTNYVTVPGGIKSLGEVDHGKPWDSRRSVDISRFEVMSTEVTNAQFFSFLQAQSANLQIKDGWVTYTGISTPLKIFKLNDAIKCQNSATSCTTLIKDATADNKPVTHVTYYGADLFAKAETKAQSLQDFEFDLPAASEWEYMAKLDSNLYATTNGNDRACNATPPNMSCSNTLLATDSLNGVSSRDFNGAKVYFLAENVAEWTKDNQANASFNILLHSSMNPVNNIFDRNNDFPASFFNNKIVKGGSYKDSVAQKVSTFRGVRPGQASDDVGFRLVKRPTATVIDEITLTVVPKYCNFWEATVYLKDNSNYSMQCETCPNSCETCFVSYDQSNNKVLECATCNLNAELDTANPGTCKCKQGFEPNPLTGECQPANAKCSNDEFFDTVNQICRRCDTPCKGCNNNPISCIECMPNAVKTAAGVCICQEGYVDFLGLGCLPVAPEDACPRGTQDNGKGKCRACPPTCSACAQGRCNQSDCVPGAQYDNLSGSCNCPAGTQLVGNSCVCSKGFYHEGSSCQACSSGCAQCKDADTCDVCVDNKAKFDPSSKLCECQEGLVWNADSTECILPPGTKCHPSCVEDACQDEDRYHCTVCSNKQFIYDEEAHRCDCPSGFVWNDQKSACVPCANPSCKRCSLQDLNQCTACEGISILDNTNNCICPKHFSMSAAQICEPKLYFPSCGLDSFISKTGDCAKCHPSCKSCMGPNADQCLTCSPGAVFDSPWNNLGKFSFGTCSCQPGYFMEGNICKPCDLTCELCYGPGPRSCITCSPGLTEVIKPNGVVECACDPDDMLAEGGCVPIDAVKCGNTYREYEIADDTCGPCPDKCSSCDSSGECTGCQLPFIFLNEENSASCELPPGFFEDQNGSIAKCHPSCKRCVGPSPKDCHECKDFRVGVQDHNGDMFCACDKNTLVAEDGSCMLRENPAGYFTTEEGLLNECHSSCRTCVGPKESQCTTCADKAILVNKSSPFYGRCVCPPKMYTDPSGVCKPCSASCAECVGPDSDQCISCDKFSQLAESLFGQVCNCKTGFTRDNQGACSVKNNSNCGYHEIFSDIEKRCVACDAKCDTCSGSTTNCAECEYPLSKDTAGVCQCPESQRWDDTAKSCVSCPGNCKKCDKSGCLDCVNGKTESGTCVCDSNQQATRSGACWPRWQSDSCPFNTYLYKEIMKCTPCHLTCTSCSGPSKNDCLTCPDGRQIMNGACSCPPGTYLNSTGDCKPCNDGCGKCNDTASCLECVPNSSRATTGNTNTCVCATNFSWNATTRSCEPVKHNSLCLIREYLDSADKKCKPCGYDCWTCIGPNANQCMICPYGATKTNVSPAQTFSNVSIGTCSCPKGTFYDIGANKCSPCDFHCDSCFGPFPDQCRSCSIGSILQKGDGCVCDADKFEEGEGVCLLKDRNKACLGPADHYIGKVINDQDCMKKCDDAGCAVCSDVIVGACTACNVFANFKLVPVSGACVCMDGFYLSSGKCVPCVNSNCGTCANGSSCTSCLNGYTLNNPTTGANDCSRCTTKVDAGICLTANVNCAPGRFSSSAGCQDCNPKCATCNWSSEWSCLSCKPGMVPFGNTCVCEKGLFWDSTRNACTPCNSNCESCENGASNCLVCAFGFVENVSSPNTQSQTQYKQCVCPPNTNLVNGKCTPNLNLGCDGEISKYIDSDGSCSYCDPNCKACKEVSDQCLICPDDKDVQIKEDGSINCVCPRGTFLNSTPACQPCDPSCAACTDDSSEDCIACAPDYIWNPIQTACKPSEGWTQNNGEWIYQATPGPCGTSKFRNEGLCQNCAPGCKICENATSCSVCDWGKIWDDTAKKCYIPGYFETTSNTTGGVGIVSLTKCKSNCVTCSDATTCLTCIPGRMNAPACDKCADGWYMAADGKCYKQTSSLKCPDGYIDEQGICGFCHLSCYSCVGPAPDQCTECDPPQLDPSLSLLDKLATNYPGLFKCECKEAHFFDFRSPQPTCTPCPDSECTSCYLDKNGVECETCSPTATLIQVGDDTKCECLQGFSRNDHADNCLPDNGCDIGFYLDKATGDCNACHNPCTVCLGEGESECLVCGEPYVLYPIDNPNLSSDDGALKQPANGYCGCPLGTFATVDGDDNNICAECIRGCNKCSNEQSCLECDNDHVLNNGVCDCRPGFVFNNDSQSCVIDLTQKCLPGNFFDSASSTCKACASSCATCVNGTSCTSCIKDLSLNPTNGACTCRLGFYNAAASGSKPDCRPCGSGCGTCSAAEPNKCISCVPNADLTNSICRCRSGFVFSIERNECYPAIAADYPHKFLSKFGVYLECDSTCRDCAGLGKDECTVCNKGATLSYTDPNKALYGICKCPENQFFSPEGFCTACHPLCASCTGPSEYECNQCSTYAQKVEDGSCECINSYELNYNTMKCEAIVLFPECGLRKYRSSTGTCELCHKSCLTCDGASEKHCVSCEGGSALQVLTKSLNGFELGRCDCDGKYFFNTNLTPSRCDSCDPTCMDCFGPLPQQCNICAFDRNLTPATYTESGATKQGNKCVCEDGYQESNPAGQCNAIVASTVCPKDQFQSGTSCFKCDDSCNSCNGAGVSACLSCNLAAGFVLVKSSSTAISGTCSCPEGSYFDQANRACRRCHSSCKTCSSFDDSSCLTCAPYSKLDSGKCVCTIATNYDAIKNVCIGNDTCIDGSYNGKTGTCTAKCPALCGKCTGPEPGYCTTCKTGTVTVNYSVPGFVTCVCPEGKYFDGTSCVGCHYSCGKCTGPNKWECTDCTYTREFNPVDSIQTQPTEEPIDIGTCDCKMGYEDRNRNECVLVPLFDGCELSQYIDLEYGTCNPCHPSCSNCIGPNERDCVNCPPNSFIPFPQEKLDSQGRITHFGACICQEGFYWDQVNEICAPCKPNCQRCRAGDTCDECSIDRDNINHVCTCKSGMQERNGNCEYMTQGVCPVKTYLSNTRCVNCDSSCMVCKGPSRVECTACDYKRNYILLEVKDAQDAVIYATCQCKKGFFKNENGACEACHPTCQSCIGKNYDQCLTCDFETMVPFEETPTTVRCECVEGRFWDEISASCIDPTSECNDGFFLSAGRVCSPCSPECATCAGPSAYECIDCATGLNYDEEIQQCVCPDTASYIDTFSGTAECKECSKLCHRAYGCFGPSPADCYHCADSAILRSYDIDGIEVTECVCPPNHFFDGNTCISIDCDDEFTKCKTTDCDESCSACVGPDAHQCALCHLGAVLEVIDIQEDIEYGECQCNDGFALLSDFSCDRCPNGCLECEADETDELSCLRCQALSELIYDDDRYICECVEGFYFDIEYGSCQSYEYLECPIGMFYDGEYCHECHSSCHICSGPKSTDCLICKTELNFEMTTVGTSAACVCAPGTYQEQDWCSPCNLSCQECVGPAVNDCTECYDGMELKNDAPAACVCPTDQIYDPYSDRCSTIDDQNCDSPCTTCTESGLCMDCEPDFIKLKTEWLGIVNCVCPPGKYFDYDNRECADCDQSCGECFGPRYDECTSCREGEDLELTYFSSKCLCPMESFRYGALCLTSPPSDCKLGQYQDASMNCQNCDKTCLTCSGPAINNCLDCDYLVAIKAPDNKCVCKPGFFRDPNSICQPCDPRCKECTTSATACSACFPGSFISGTGCNAQQGWIWDNINRVFKQNNKCDLREFLKGEDCLLCSDECYTCNGPYSDDCTSCDPNSPYALKGTRCECKDGLFSDYIGECVKCNSRCANCVGDREDECLTCPANSSPVKIEGSDLVKCTCNSGYIFNQFTQKCELETACAAGLYKGASGCQECSKNCASCVGPGPDQCLSCPSTRLSYLVDIYEGKQLFKCYCDDSKFESSTGECLACHKTCQTCHGSTEFDCDICKMGSSLVQSSGVAKCDCNPYFSKDATTLVCTPQPTSTKCNLSQFYNIFLDTPACEECDLSCNTCIGDKFSDCISCPPLAEFIQMTYTDAIRGICSCPYGSYMGKDTNGKKACLPCAKGCADCDANKCYECSGYYRFNPNSVCECPWALNSAGNCQPPTANSACTAGTYWDSVSSSCNECHRSCVTCYGPSYSDCTSCDTTDNFVWDTRDISPIVDKVPITVGKCRCAPGFYLAFGHCQLCDPTCNTCAGPEDNQCLSCRQSDMTLVNGRCSCTGGKIFNYNLEICALQCNAGQFTDFEGNCQSCAPECNGCYGPGNDQCIDCAADYVGHWLETGDFICKCARGSYLDQGTCVDCDDECDDCLGAPDHCIACADPKELKQIGTKGSCVCKFGWELNVSGVCELSKINECSFANEYVDENGDCMPCYYSCGTCKGPESYQCINCKENAEFHYGMCICNSGYYMDEYGDCIKCGELCNNCDQTYCFDCPPGTYSGAGGDCIQCDDSCLTCFESTSTDCSSCEYPKKLNGGECLCPSGWTPTGSGCEAPTDGCPLGNYFSSGVCLKCSYKCSSCVGPKDSDCTSCYPDSNRSLLSNAKYGNCRCDEGFIEVEGECVPCDPKCKVCNGLGPDRCTICQYGMELLPTAAGSSCFCNGGALWSNYTASCIQPNTHWEDEFRFRKPCDPDCKTCVGPNKDECALCNSEMNLVEDPNRDGAMIGKCVCDQGFFRNQFEECEACDDLCTSCSGPGKCSVCVSFATLKTVATGSYCECNPNYKPLDRECVSALQEGCESGCTCDDSCFACSGTEPYECLTCHSEMIFSPVSTTSSTAITGYCKCPVGKRLVGGLCEPCGDACLECDDTECIICAPNTQGPVNGEFNCLCSNYYVLSNDSKCEVNTALFCSGKQGYYLSPKNVCEPCHPSCSSCLGPQETECITCKIDGQITNADDICECPIGTVVVDGVCVPCDQNCLTCSRSPTNCTTCKTGFQELPVSGKCVCPTLTILDIKNNVCARPISDATCHPTCKVCLAPDAADQCTECKTGFIPMNKSTIFPCGCAVGKFLSGATCANCDPKCTSCIGSATYCTACATNASLDYTDMTCRCVDGYVANPTTGVCEVAKGSANCPANQFDSDSTSAVSCRNCHASCLSCIGPNDNNCLACPTGTEIEDNDGDITNGVKCLCKLGLFFESGTCKACPTNCYECTSLAVCTVCKEGSVLSSGKCVCDFGFTADASGKCQPPQGSSNKCLYNEYLTKTGFCLDCHYSCLNCSEGSEFKCLTCAENRVKDINGVCICKQGFFEDNTGVCMPCNASCTKCTGPNRDSCQACVSTNSLLVSEENSCKCFDTAQTDLTLACTPPNTSDCAAGQFRDSDNTCKPCSASCATCFGTATSCLKCADKYALDSAGACVCLGYMNGNTCTVCPSLCSECTSSGCTTCAVGAVRDDVTGACKCDVGYYLQNNSCILIPTCNTSEFFSTTLKRCSPCHLTCNSCSETTHQDCTSCKTNATLLSVSASKAECKCNLGYYLDTATGNCLQIPTCSAGQFLSSTYKCLACHPTCYECIGPNEGDCISCKQGISITITNAANKTGLCKCSTGKFFDSITKLCVDCDVACATCSGAGNKSCLNCNVGYIKDLETGVCNCNVNAGSYSNANKECKLCNASCGGCSGPSAQECTKCKDDKVLAIINSSVVGATGSCTCKGGFYYDNATDSCKLLPNCPGENYFVTFDASNKAVCTKCDNSCRTCLGSGADKCTSCPVGVKLFSSNTVVSYTGPISGTCTCSNLSGTQCQDIPCPTSAGFYINTPANTSSLPFCAQCDKSCKTCSNGATNGCLSCEFNYILTPNSAGDPTGTCKCDPNYQDPKDPTRCNSSLTPQSSTSCPLTKDVCSKATDCTWSSTATSTNQLNDRCLKQIYDYCCTYDASQSGCSRINYQFSECSLISVPNVESAKFSDDSTIIRIKFSNGVFLRSKKCIDIFNDSASILGTDAECSQDDLNSPSILNIRLGYKNTVTVGTKIGVKSGAYSSNHKYASKTNNYFLLAIESPNSVPSPDFDLQVPDSVGTCGNNFAKAIVKGNSGNRDLTYEWKINGSVIAGATTSQLSFTASGTSLTISCTVRNFLGGEFSASKTVNVVSEAINVAFPYDTLSADSSKEVLLKAVIGRKGCNSNEYSSFSRREWTLVDTDDTSFTQTLTQYVPASDPNSLKIPANTLLPGNRYKFQFSVSSSATSGSGSVSGLASVTVNTRTSSINVKLTGGDLGTSVSTQIYIDGSASNDPNDLKGAFKSSWVYSWSCEDWTSKGLNPLYSRGVTTTNLDQEVIDSYRSYKPTTCLDVGGANLVSTLRPNGATLSIPANRLPSGKIFYFILKISYNNESISGTGYTWVKTTDASVQIGVQVINSPQYLTSGDNTLAASVTSPDSNYSIQWSYIKSTTDTTTITWLSGTTRPKVKFSGQGLSIGTIYSFQVTVTRNGQTATATYSGTLNSPPSGGGFTVTKQSNNLYTIDFGTWTDKEGDLPLYYMVESYPPSTSNETPKLIKWGQTSVFTDVLLTAGKDYDKLTLIGYVQDALNNEVETSSATVTLVVPEDPVASTTTLLESYEESSNAMDSTEKLNYLTQMANQLNTEVSEDQSESGQDIISDLNSKINNECSSDELTDAVIDQCASAYESTLSAASSLSSTDTGASSETSSTILDNLNNLLTQVSNPSDTFLINYQESATKANSYGNVSERAKARGTQDTLTVDTMLSSMCSKVSETLLIEGMSKEVSSTSMKTICSEYEKADLDLGLLQNLLVTQSGVSYSVGIMANAGTISSSDSTVTVSTSSTFTTFSEFSEEISQISNSFIYSISGLTESESCDNISVTLALLSSLLPESYEEDSIKCYSIINGSLQEVAVESINIQNNQVVCSSCESGSYLAAYVVEKEVPIDDDSGDDEDIINIDRDDDWEVWRIMNPSYVLVILLAGLVVSGVVGFILDKYSPVKIAKPNTPVANQPTFQANPGEQKVVPEEIVSHHNSPAKFSGSQSQSWMPSESPDKMHHKIETPDVNDNYLDTTVIQPVEEKSGCCEYMFREHIIISYLVNTKSCYSRPARAAVFFSVLFMQLAIIGALLEYSDIDEFVYASIIVAGITLFAGPVFSLLYIVPSKLKGIKKVVKIIIAWLALFILLVVTIIPIIISTDDVTNSSDNRFWLKAFAVSVSFEIFISEPIRTAVKFGMQRHSKSELIQAF